MTMIQLIACIGMIAGLFMVLHVSPRELSDSLFSRLTAAPGSIRADINETTRRKKAGFLRREITEAQAVLAASGRADRFPMVCFTSRSALPWEPASPCRRKRFPCAGAGCWFDADPVLVCQTHGRQLQKGCGSRTGNCAVRHYYGLPAYRELSAGRGGECPLPAPSGAGGVPALSDAHQAHRPGYGRGAC